MNYSRQTTDEWMLIVNNGSIATNLPRLTKWESVCFVLLCIFVLFLWKIALLIAVKCSPWVKKMDRTFCWICLKSFVFLFSWSCRGQGFTVFGWCARWGANQRGSEECSEDLWRYCLINDFGCGKLVNVMAFVFRELSVYKPYGDLKCSVKLWVSWS